MVRLMGNVTFTSESGGQSIPVFTVAGGRSYNQMWNLDGGAAQNQSNGSPQLSLNPPNEALQEFKVLANNYPAEYGRSGSGYIVMTTRTGTNEFHGAAYEWLRNDKLNARTFFSAGNAGADKSIALRFQIFRPALGVHKERVAAIDEDVPRRKMGQKLLDELVHGFSGPIYSRCSSLRPLRAVRPGLSPPGHNLGRRRGDRAYPKGGEHRGGHGFCPL